MYVSRVQREVRMLVARGVADDAAVSLLGAYRVRTSTHGGLIPMSDVSGNQERE